MSEQEKKEPTRRIFTTDRETLEKECIVEFLKGSGPGGQHKNKRETGVRLHHEPSGLTIMATERRSQVQNLEMAFERLITCLKALNRVPKPRKKTRTPARAVAKRLESKKTQSRKKDVRKKPKIEE